MMKWIPCCLSFVIITDHDNNKNNDDIDNNDNVCKVIITWCLSIVIITVTKTLKMKQALREGAK